TESEDDGLLDQDPGVVPSLLSLPSSGRSQVAAPVRASRSQAARTVEGPPRSLEVHSFHLPVVVARRIPGRRLGAGVAPGVLPRLSERQASENPSGGLLLRAFRLRVRLLVRRMA